MSFTGNLGVTHGGIFIAHSHVINKFQIFRVKKVASFPLLTLSCFGPHLDPISFECHNSANSGRIFMIPPLTNVLIA
jgi:hypothetical protein